ncbi:VanZ family protein [Virgibacillus sp. W0181]|uniref:VanZ family protein n=1 Tax=Virgibacillus sp. W0181 TaxID=3391581 RepID=UPI003F446F51
MYKYGLWAAVFIWMWLIFYLSHQQGTSSSELSSGITEVIKHAIEKVFPHSNIDIEHLHHVIRKNAHFFAYFVLGWLIIYAWRNSGIDELRSVVFAICLCVLYAISDEIHQLFVPGRSGEVRDVFIDSAGSVTGVGTYLLIGYLRGIVKRSRKK